MRLLRISALAVALLMVVSMAQAAEVCLVLTDTGETWQGQATGGIAGYYSLALMEPNFQRAAYGSAALDNGLFIGATKNTSAATVHLQCVMDQATFVGSCTVHVIWTNPLSADQWVAPAELLLGPCMIEKRPMQERPTGEAR